MFFILLLCTKQTARIKIAGPDVYITPGDYIVNEEYGVGKYLGIRMVDLSPARTTRAYVPAVVVQYKVRQKTNGKLFYIYYIYNLYYTQDGEVTWFQHFAAKELWLFRTAGSGEHDLDSVLNLKKWKRLKEKTNKNSKVPIQYDLL